MIMKQARRKNRLLNQLFQSIVSFENEDDEFYTGENQHFYPTKDNFKIPRQ